MPGLCGREKSYTRPGHEAGSSSKAVGDSMLASRVRVRVRLGLGLGLGLG